MTRIPFRLGAAFAAALAGTASAAPAASACGASARRGGRHRDVALTRTVAALDKRLSDT